MTSKTNRDKPDKPDKPEPDKPAADEPPADGPAANIVGTWVREDADEAPYPDEITFDPDGIYTGTKASGGAVASKLDVGVFDRIDETSIRLSTATDRNETFGLDLSEDDLKLVDEEGKELSYKRKSGDLMAAEAPSAEGEPEEAEETYEPDVARSKASSNEEWMP